MRSLPDGWPRISSCVFYDDPRAAIDWLCKAFGFEARLLVEAGDGSLVHTEIVYGDGVIMVGGVGTRPHFRSPAGVGGGNTQSLMVYVDDAHGDAYWSDRSYGAIDCGGHHWWFCERLETGDASYSKVRNKVEVHDAKGKS